MRCYIYINTACIVTTGRPVELPDNSIFFDTVIPFSRDGSVWLLVSLHAEGDGCRPNGFWGPPEVGYHLFLSTRHGGSLMRLLLDHIPVPMKSPYWYSTLETWTSK